MTSSSHNLDLLLINPGSRAKIYQSLGSAVAAVEPPVWALMLAAFTRKSGYSVAVLDAEAEELDGREAARRAAEMEPALVAVVVYGQQPSASTQNMSAAGEVCSALKEEAPGLKTVLLGGHVAALPERTLREEAADFVAAGEGFYTLLELLQTLKSARPNYERVRGLWYWDGETPKSNLPAPLVLDLDQQIPALPWDLVPMDLYRAHNWHCFGGIQRQPYVALYTTLGCPYRCSFCCIQAPFKSGEQVLGYKGESNSYRFWDPAVVVNQIDELVNHYGVQNIKFADEMFVLNNRHVLEICDLIIERGHDLNIWAYARVDTIRGEQILDRLKRAGVNWLALGIESATPTVRDGVAKTYKQEEIFQTIERVRAAGINVIGNYIFGLPEDDSERMQATLDLALELNCEFANFYTAMGYPGSELYDQAVQKCWPLPEHWSGYSQHSEDTLPLPTNYLRGSEVLRFRDQAWQTYFTNENYLQLIRKKFGEVTVQQMEDLTSHTLVRKNV